MSRETSRELINQYIDLEIELEWTSDEEEKKAIQAKIIELQEEIKQKVENIDWFLQQLSRRRGRIEGEIDALRDELKLLYNRRKGMERTEDYLMKTLLPMLIETAGEDGKLETKFGRYSMYETWGGIEVEDEESVPNAYKVYKTKIDKKAATDAIKDGTEIPGLKLNKVTIVRRT